MRYLKYFALLAVLAVPAVYASAQVSIGVGVQIGPDYGYYHEPPVCDYGYYPYYPYACAPYGYWGPQWFVSGLFIGAGPWDHFYYRHPEFYERWGFIHRDRDFRAFNRDRDFRDHDAFRGERFRGDDRGFRGREGFRGDDRGFRGREGSHPDRGGERFRGGESRGGGHEFHGGGGHEHR